MQPAPSLFRLAFLDRDGTLVPPVPAVALRDGPGIMSRGTVPVS